MRIRVINPNTTWSMTTLIGDCARSVADPRVLVEAVSASMGPASIESHYDEALAVPGILSEIAKGEADGVDGYVIACFGDPGLEAARELASGPVVGIAEAAMRTATYLGRSFSVVTTLGRTRGRAWDLAERYHVSKACRGVHACEIPVLELETSPDARERITQACREALALDESDVIVLGCAGMADLCAYVSKEVGAPVVDGVAAATVAVQGLTMLGLRTSAMGEFSRPSPKAYSGLLAGFGLSEGNAGPPAEAVQPEPAHVDAPAARTAKEPTAPRVAEVLIETTRMVAPKATESPRVEPDEVAPEESTLVSIDLFPPDTTDEAAGVPDADMTQRVALGTEATSDDGRVAAEHGPLVQGIVCSRGHFNRPQAGFCARCDISMVHQTHNLVTGPRPRLGVLVVDDGSVFALNCDVAIGREPEVSDDVISGSALPLFLEDSGLTMSRVHAKLILDGWEVRVQDAGSANGTYVLDSSDADWIRLEPGVPTTIEPGTRLSFGGRTLTFESHQPD